MPTPNNPFEQIILPVDVPSAWPPAPIYWLILVAVIAVSWLTFFLVKRHIKKKRIVKQALASLQQLQKDNASFAQLNQLLKGLCLHYYPREQVASITGQAWFNFLQAHHTQQGVTLFNNQDEFCRRLYQDNSSCTEKDFLSAKKWIQAFPTQFKARQTLALKNKQLAGKKDV
ncbi:DUF4381 domain-containing protein [uncultured Psychromonas sp.]|uniref:DUF4381 domain-containing protein n=1 Tax=uncultured Psychromonas sp. TaxID=173974 RepID=UPI002616D0D3|nr:DUF4381 domain-containing protein [uncultured Psychromonas sp.]